MSPPAFCRGGHSIDLLVSEVVYTTGVPRGLYVVHHLTFRHDDRKSGLETRKENLELPTR